MGLQFQEFVEEFDEEVAERRHRLARVADIVAFVAAVIDGLTLTRRDSILRVPEEKKILEELIQFALRRRIESSQGPSIGGSTYWTTKPHSGNRVGSRWRKLEEAARRSLALTKMTPLQRLAVEGISEQRMLFV